MALLIKKSRFIENFHIFVPQLSSELLDYGNKTSL